jgi:hypothetical protein
MLSESARRHPIAALLTVACVAGYLVFSFLPTLRAVTGTEGNDFASYYYGLRVALDGGSPYDAAALADRSRAEGGVSPVHPFFYPPPALLVLLPAAFLSLRDAVVGMYLFNHLVLAAAGWMLWVLLGRREALLPALAFLLLTFSPIQINNQWGQINLWVLLLILSGLVLIDRGRDLPGGILLGAAAMVKISPALLVAWMIYRRRWRGLAGAAVSAILLTLFSLPLVGPANQLHFYTRVLPEFRAGGNYSGLSISLRSTGIHSLPRLWHLILPNPESLTVLSPAAATASSISSLALIAGVALALRARGRESGRDSLGETLETGAVMVLMVILPTFAYDHHLVFLLLPLAALAAAIESRRLGARWLVALSAAYVCLAVPRAAQEAALTLMGLVSGPAGRVLRGLVLEARLLAACVVMAACVAAARRESPMTAAVS